MGQPEPDHPTKKDSRPPALGFFTNITAMKNLSTLIFFIFISFLCAPLLKAIIPSEVVINEIAWMGTEISYNAEWLELYNNSNSAIKLDGWMLKAVDGTPKIDLKGTILARSFFLLERTSDEAVPDISADLIYKGNLKNKGEDLELYNKSGVLVDFVRCSSWWFSGDNSTKQTMERKDPSLAGSSPSNWQTSQKTGGTPKKKNSPGFQEEKEIKVETLKAQEFQDSSPPPVTQGNFPALLTAFTVAVSSGGVILLLKKKSKAE